MDLQRYAMLKNQFVPWETFLSDHQCINKFEHESVPDHCVAVYYVVENYEVVDRLYVVTWSSQYAHVFKLFNLTWVEEFFEVEEQDVKQLNAPFDAIIRPGGQIFFLLNSDKVVGTVAMIPRGEECELSKLAITSEYAGKSYSHPLMRQCLLWAKQNTYPSIVLLSNTKLKPAIALYKRYSFETVHLGQYPGYNRCNIVMRLTL